jgi:hypothetical protein
MSAMKRAFHYTMAISVALAVAGLSFRLLWYAANTETGYDTLRRQWSDATWGWIRGPYTPVGSLVPKLQAQVWLKEIARHDISHRGDARVVMGAALVLDCPSPGYIVNYFEEVDSRAAMTLDQERVQAAEDLFEADCKASCLALAAKATELEPHNVQWWRLRAILLWRNSTFSYDAAPRDDNWRSILDQAARHDPDNALYDYLAARYYWSSSAEVVYQADIDRLVVRDAERFNQGTACFELGRSKRYFAVGDAGFTAVVDFLSLTAVPLIEHEEVINRRRIFTRHYRLLHDVWSWQYRRADQAFANGSSHLSLAIHRQNLRLIDQFAEVGTWTKYQEVVFNLRALTIGQLRSLTSKHNDLFTNDEISEVGELNRETRIAKRVWEEASKELRTILIPRPPPGVTIKGNVVTLANAVIVDILPALFVILIVCGIGGAAVSLFRSDNDLPSISILGHCISFAAALLSTVVVFGLAPANVIAQTIQAWTLTVSLFLIPVVLVLWITWSWLRRRHFRVNLRTVFVGTSVAAVLLAIISLATPHLTAFAQFPFDLSIPTRGWNYLDAKSIETALPSNSTWLWVTLQWTFYSAQYVTLAVWAAIMAIFLRLRQLSTLEAAGVPAPSFRKWFRGWMRSLGTAFLTLSVAVMLLYLCLITKVMNDVDVEFQQRMAFARNPDAFWSAVDNAVQDVRANAELMTQIEAMVDIEMSNVNDAEEREAN